MIHFNAEQVTAREHENLSPDAYDFHWNANYTECDAIPLRWHDDSSYLAYQGMS